MALAGDFSIGFVTNPVARWPRAGAGSDGPPPAPGCRHQPWRIACPGPSTPGKHGSPRFEAALCAVERLSLDTATDMTDADCNWLSELLHGPRQPLSRDAVLRILREIATDRGGSIRPIH
jgi:hypothetical protein